MKIDATRVLDVARRDSELGYKLRNFTGTIAIDLGEDGLTLVVDDGVISDVKPSGRADATMRISAPEAYWRESLAQVPRAGFDSLTTGLSQGLKVVGDFALHVSPYQGALHRLLIVLRTAASGPTPRRNEPAEPWRETDTAVGRYVHVTSGGETARIYYEEAGSGPVPLVLQHTAGSDSRQYRHVLANPELQKRFRMIAWDLPGHGRSFLPQGTRWWEQPYRTGLHELVAGSCASKDAIGLDRPIYLGCSVGGQLALDLAAEAPEHFRAFIPVNGWYEIVSRGPYNNDIHRLPTTSPEYFSSLILAATGPQSPEAAAQEVFWVYRSNFPGIYAGDNDYFMNEHDLRRNGHKIVADKTPVIMVSGEYDGNLQSPEHGAEAVVRHVPGVEHHVLPGLSHFAPADDPVAFCEQMIPIFDRLLARLELKETV
jgi:pimeloyl-ACP methyl ester carboxylesterase